MRGQRRVVFGKLAVVAVGGRAGTPWGAVGCLVRDHAQLGAVLAVSLPQWTLALDQLPWVDWAAGRPPLNHPPTVKAPPVVNVSDLSNALTPLPPALADPCGFRGRVRVKICGITCARDAEWAVQAGADALGFNAWKGSKRYMDVAAGGAWLRDLSGFVTRVVLCVNHPLEEALSLGGLPFVDVAQFHGDESDDFCKRYSADGRPHIRALRPKSERDLDQLATVCTRQVLLDAAVTGAYGGTGARADFALAAQAVSRFPSLGVVLAGGLDPDNVAEAVRMVRPYAVDVASGVESSPGKKDPVKMRDFVQAVLGAV